MRILQLLNRVPWPLHDGGSIGYYNFIRGYSEAGCEVTVLAMNTSRHPVLQLPPELTAIASWHLVEVDNRIKPLDALVNLWGSQSYHIQRFVSATYEQQLRTLLLSHQFDVVIFESLFVMPYLETVKSLSSALTVLRQHNVEHIIWNMVSNRTHNPFKRWYLKELAARLKLYEEIAINKVDALTTVTANDQQILLQMGCIKPIHVTPLAVSIQSDLTTAQPRTVFHIGSMEWMPNKDGIRWFLREVWPKVLAVVPGAILHLAGRGIHKVFLTEPNVNVRIDGEVADATAYMKAYQIMIVPLFSGSGIRVKILEGMAAGKAIVSTTLGAQGIAGAHNQHLILADTPETFAAAIIELLQSPQKIKTMGEEAQSLIKNKYSYANVIGKVIDFYRIQIQNKLADV